MSNSFEKAGQEAQTYYAQLTALDRDFAAAQSQYDARRAALAQAVAEERTKALELAKNDIYLENDPVAKVVVKTGKTTAGEEIGDLKEFFLERRQWVKDNPDAMKGGLRRPEDLPRDVRADDPDIWRKGTGK